ncbi:proline-specific peptidase [Auricularia subglabra TFB-10046 SS5]|nr:proline-specific peptidase [Auricularia subglabra TFB-10046 SS5]
MSVRTGELDFDVPAAGKPCKTWYEIHGDHTAARPLIVLHGGPGIDHHYVAPIARLYHTHGIPVILYDQLGAGNSTHLAEKKGDKSFWTIQLFLDELDNLVRGLGLSEYDLLGHSWGGILGAEHAVRRPTGLRRLILASPPSSMKLWLEAANKLRGQLAQDVQDTMAKYEAKEDFDAPEYHGAVMEFYKRFVCRSEPMAPELLESFSALDKDNTVYMTMNGPNEFFVTGVIKDWSVIDRIHQIDRPTLLTNGYYDEAQNSVVLPYFENLKEVRWVKFAQSSHVPHLEERERYLQIIGQFLLE